MAVFKELALCYSLRDGVWSLSFCDSRWVQTLLRDTDWMLDDEI